MLKCLPHVWVPYKILSIVNQILSILFQSMSGNIRRNNKNLPDSRSKTTIPKNQKWLSHYIILEYRSCGVVHRVVFCMTVYCHGSADVPFKMYSMLWATVSSFQSWELCWAIYRSCSQYWFLIPSNLIFWILLCRNMEIFLFNNAFSFCSLQK